MNLITLAMTQAPPADGAEMNFISTAAITAVCSLISGIVLYTKGKQARTVTIDKQPVEIALQKEFVTRLDFSEFKGEVKADFREMRGSYEKLTMLIEERDRKLSDMIEKVAAGAFEGRRRIHDEVNHQGKSIARLESKGEISKGLATLGKAIMSRPCTANTQPNKPS